MFTLFIKSIIKNIFFNYFRFVINNKEVFVYSKPRKNNIKFKARKKKNQRFQLVLSHNVKFLFASLLTALRINKFEKYKLFAYILFFSIYIFLIFLSLFPCILTVNLYYGNLLL